MLERTSALADFAIVPVEPPVQAIPRVQDHRPHGGEHDDGRGRGWHGRDVCITPGTPGRNRAAVVASGSMRPDARAQEVAARLAPLLPAANLTGLDVDAIAGLLAPPPKPELGEFAFPCFRLAKALRRKIPREIREGHLEQYRASWRSDDIPDSEIVVSFSMITRPADQMKPMITFSSKIENFPYLIADALEKNHMPLVRSFFVPLSPDVE